MYNESRKAAETFAEPRIDAKTTVTSTRAYRIALMTWFPLISGNRLSHGLRPRRCGIFNACGAWLGIERTVVFPIDWPTRPVIVML